MSNSYFYTLALEVQVGGCLYIWTEPGWLFPSAFCLCAMLIANNSIAVEDGCGQTKGKGEELGTKLQIGNCEVAAVTSCET